MDYVEFKVFFNAPDEELASELISDLFYSLGAKGVVIDDPHLQPDEGWGSDAIGPPARPAVSAYLPAGRRLEQGRIDLEQALRDLAGRLPLQYRIESRHVAEEEWAEAWKAFFHPQPITQRLVVKPSWHAYSPSAGQHVIEIDPGMAFGTGTHPTTALCLQLLEEHVRPGFSVLDVGTGSGILLIAAAKLGASRLTGVDLDPVAVQIARRNLLRNGIDPLSFRLACGRLLHGLCGRYDLVTANILADVVIELLDDLGRVIKPGGLLICSGIILRQQPDVARKIADSGLELIESRVKEEWAAMAAARPVAPR